MIPRRAVFLDKDGTLVENVPYNVDPARIRLLPGAEAGLQQLAAAGYELVVITNQPGIALGLFDWRALGQAEARLRELFAELGVELAGFYACPHHPSGVLSHWSGACDCRKPQPGLLRQAAAELDLNLEASWMVGDILNDIEAGQRAGCRTVLILSGGETEWEITPDRTPTYVAADLVEAARAILAHDPPRATADVRWDLISSQAG